MVLALAAALLLGSPQDSVQVRAALSASRIAAGGTAVLSIEVETGGATPEEIPLPVLPPGIETGQVSDYSQLQVSFPGARRRTTRREVVLRGVIPGRYRVPAINVIVAGRSYRTAALTLAVDPAGASAGRTPPGDVSVRAWAVPEVAFAGQQVLYHVQAAFPEQLRLRQSRPPDFEPPVAPEFWAYELPEPIVVRLRTSGGVAAEVQEYRQALFPLSAGALLIPPARVQYEIRQGIAFTPSLHSLATNPVTVRVQPLPPGAPAGFTGAVGSFTVRSELGAARAATGEPVTLRVTIEGSGNIKALGRPRLGPIPGLEVLDAGERVELGFADGVVSGRKEFDWTLVAGSAGRRTVPALTYSWFDPGMRSYRSGHTAPLALEITGASAARATRALAPLRTRPSAADWTRAPLFYAVQLLPLFGVGALWLRRRRRTVRSAGQPGHQLRLAEQHLADPRVCLEHLSAWLAQRGGPAAAQLRATVRQARYAPSPPSPAQCEELLHAARHLPEDGPGKWGGGAAGLVLLGFAAASGLAAQDDVFARGVAAYRVHAYREAADHFAAHLRTRPQDGAAWYNLGNAAYRAGDPGRAGWAWLRALRAEPRNQPARQNLRLAGMAAAERALAPDVALADREARLLASLCWWLAAACFAYALAGRGNRRAGAGAGAALLVLMLASLALPLARALLPTRGVTLTPGVLQAAPSLRADTLRALPPGSPLVVRERRPGWLLVRARDLREGWTEARNVGVL